MEGAHLQGCLLLHHHVLIDPLHVQEKSVKLHKLSSNLAAMLEYKHVCKLVLVSAKWCYCSIVVHGRQPTK